MAAEPRLQSLDEAALEQYKIAQYPPSVSRRDYTPRVCKCGCGTKFNPFKNSNTQEYKAGHHRRTPQARDREQSYWTPWILAGRFSE